MNAMNQAGFNEQRKKQEGNYECCNCGKEKDASDLVANGLGELECSKCYYESLYRLRDEQLHPDQTSISPHVNNKLPY